MWTLLWGSVFPKIQWLTCPQIFVCCTLCKFSTYNVVRLSQIVRCRLSFLFPTKVSYVLFCEVLSKTKYEQTGNDNNMYLLFALSVYNAIKWTVALPKWLYDFGFKWHLRNALRLHKMMSPYPMDFTRDWCYLRKIKGLLSSFGPQVRYL